MLLNGIVPHFWVITNNSHITWISTFFVSWRLVFILDEILDMSHLMMSSKKVIHNNSGTLFDPVKYRGTFCYVGAVSCVMV
jgi:hypothetical protein